jgi:hypothetical protein
MRVSAQPFLVTFNRIEGARRLGDLSVALLMAEGFADWSWNVFERYGMRIC